MGLRTWLGGTDTPKTDAATARRVRDHRRSIAKTTRAAGRWETRDRRDHGDDHPFPRR